MYSNLSDPRIPRPKASMPFRPRADIHPSFKGKSRNITLPIKPKTV